MSTRTATVVSSSLATDYSDLSIPGAIALAKELESKADDLIVKRDFLRVGMVALLITVAITLTLVLTGAISAAFGEVVLVAFGMSFLGTFAALVLVLLLGDRLPHGFLLSRSHKRITEERDRLLGMLLVSIPDYVENNYSAYIGRDAAFYVAGGGHGRFWVHKNGRSMECVARLVGHRLVIAESRRSERAVLTLTRRTLHEI